LEHVNWEELNNWWSGHCKDCGNVEIEDIMFKSYGIVIADINKNPKKEIERYKKEENLMTTAQIPVNQEDTSGELTQGKFRVFTTRAGGMYLGVLSNAGNTIYEQYSQGGQPPWGLHKIRSKKDLKTTDYKDVIKNEVQNTYKQIRNKVKNEVKNEEDLPPGLNKDNVKDDVTVQGSPYLYRVNTYAFLYNKTTVVARIGDSGYNRHFFTGSSLNTGMLSTLDLLTKCGSVRGTASGTLYGSHLRDASIQVGADFTFAKNKEGRKGDNKWGAVNQILRGETKDVDPSRCGMKLQVDNYNESQKTLQTLIPKEIDLTLRGRRDENPSQVIPHELHLNCNLVLFLNYFREYKKFIDTLVRPEFVKTNDPVTWLNEFTDTYYPDFLQMIEEQSNKNYTEQIINSLLHEKERDLYEKWCYPKGMKGAVAYELQMKLPPWSSYNELKTDLKKLNKITKDLVEALKRAFETQEDETKYQNFREFLAAREANEANKEIENYTSMVKNLAGVGVEGFIEDYLNSNIDKTMLNRWRKALQYDGSIINSSLAADIHIYKKLFGDKKHDIDSTGKRIEYSEPTLRFSYTQPTESGDSDSEDDDGWDDDQAAFDEWEIEQEEQAREEQARELLPTYKSQFKTFGNE